MTQFSEIELVTLTATVHGGMTVDECEAQARAWSHSAINPLTGHLFMESVYQPQLELLDYLRANGFRTYIVSGAGIDLIRTFAEESYGIPPEPGYRQQRQARDHARGWRAGPHYSDLRNS